MGDEVTSQCQCCVKSAYPPNHYIRGVPQRKVHLFTVLQLLQLAAMAAVGFAPLPYLKMGFPVIILALLPFRYLVCFHTFITFAYSTWDKLVFNFVFNVGIFTCRHRIVPLMIEKKYLESLDGH